MKKTWIVVVILGMLAMSSCLVSSIHPFFKKKDIVYDPVLLGTWIDSDSCIWIIEQNRVSEEIFGPDRPDSTYRITYYEDDESKGILQGTLFQLDGLDYLDFYAHPNEDHCFNDLVCMHHFPTHTLARVNYQADSIMFYWYGDEWLDELFRQKRIRIRHETVEINTDYARHLLTAPTEDLQKFIKKYANDPRTGINVEEIFAQGYVKDDMEDSGAFLKLIPYDGPLPEKRAKQVEVN